MVDIKAFLRFILLPTTMVLLEIIHSTSGFITLAVSGTRQRLRPKHRKMGRMVLCRTFYTAPEQGQGLTPIVPHCSGSGPSPCPGTRHSQCDYTVEPRNDSMKFKPVNSDL